MVLYCLLLDILHKKKLKMSYILQANAKSEILGAIHDPFYKPYLMFRIHIAGGVVLRTSAVCAETAGMPRWILYIGFHTSPAGKSSSFVSFIVLSLHHGLFVSILQLNFPTIILVLNLHLNHNYYLFLNFLFYLLILILIFLS